MSLVRSQVCKSRAVNLKHLFSPRLQGKSFKAVIRFELGIIQYPHLGVFLTASYDTLYAVNYPTLKKHGTAYSLETLQIVFI